MWLACWWAVVVLAARALIGLWMVVVVAWVWWGADDVGVLRLGAGRGAGGGFGV